MGSFNIELKQIKKGLIKISDEIYPSAWPVLRRIEFSRQIRNSKELFVLQRDLFLSHC